MRTFIAATLLLIAACGSSTPKTPALADVDVRSAGSLFFGSGTSAPLQLDVIVSNRGPQPITVRSIRLTSPGMVQYTLRPEYRVYNDTIPPGESKVFPMTPTVFASRARLQTSEPLNVRADLDFESGGERRRGIFHIRNVGVN